MGKGRVNRLAITHADLKNVVDDLSRAFFHADAAARAFHRVDIAGLLANLDFEIAHRSAYLFQLGIRKHGHVLVLPDFRHLRRQNAGGTIEGWKSFVELGHVPADRRFALDQVHRIARVGQFQHGLQSGDATADDQRGRLNLHLHGFERLLLLYPFGGGRHQGLDLFRARLLALGDPGNMLAHVCHLE